MLRRLIVLLALIWPHAAWADLRATYRNIHPDQPQAMVIEVADNGDARLEIAGQIWRLAIIGGDAHIVYTVDGASIVVRVADLERIMQERGLSFRLPPGMLRGWRFVERGQATYAGHRGAAFYIQEPGRPPMPRPTLVISRDPVLAALGLPMARQLDFSMATMRLGGNTPPPNLVRARELIGTGAILYFAGFELTGIDRSSIDQARFTLPGAPMTIEQLRSGGGVAVGVPAAAP